jgi:uracil-DNA glycosylase
MDDHSPRPLRAPRALRQRLESLQRAGVEQLPRVALPEPLARAAPAPPPPAAAPARPLLRPEPVMKHPAPASAAPPKLKATEKQRQLRSLCEQVQSCRLCPELVANRTQTVFGVGNPQTRLCFFGEAPGADEDRQGEPFVGRAGQLLDKIIEACTLKRSDVYILNTVKCRPPGNRNPNPDEVANCRPYFEQQLEIIRPEFICCLGLVSATALLDTKLSISKLRGTLHPWRWAKVLVTYHPAYLLRNPPAKRQVWEDMQFLMGEMGIEL